MNNISFEAYYCKVKLTERKQKVISSKID